MKVKEITEKLAKDYPPQLACAWDNPGLQVGHADREVKKIIVALDATDSVSTHASKNAQQLLVTHQPSFDVRIKTDQ